MFRKIISNLPFSPALIGQLGFYARRLRKEEATRKLGFIFMALALIVQSLTVFSPPESANAASPSDLIRGGVKSKSEILDAYDANSSNYKDFVDYAGITREELADTSEGTFNSLDDNRIITSWGRVSRFSAAEGEVVHTIPLAGGAVTQIYSTPQWRMDTLDYTKKNGSTYQAFIGYSQKNGWFAIMKNCANLAFKKEPTPPTPPPAPEPAPVKESKISKLKTAFNLTQNTVAEATTAKAGDRIEYTLEVKNDGDGAGQEVITDHLTDVLEYASLVDGGGGIYNEKDKTLSWPTVNVAEKSTEKRKIVVEIIKDIPSTPTGISDPHSFDCTIINAFGNSVTIKVDCPGPKQLVEQTAVVLPKTGPGESLLIVGFIAAIATYFYARSRLLGKELRLIRKDYNYGTL